MTVAVQTPSISYAGDGITTTFPVPFRYDAPTDLKAIRRALDGTEVQLAYGTNFTATPGPTNAGGTLTVTVPPSNGTVLVIERNTARSQTADYIETGAFPAESHERALDKAMLVNQEQDVLISRALKAPAGEVGPVLPSAANRAGRMFAFDSGGEGLFDIDADKVRQIIAAGFSPSFTQLAELVMFLAQGDGALARSVQAKMREQAITPFDFMDAVTQVKVALGTATGADAEAITVACEKALDAVPSGGEVNFPPLNYILNRTLVPARPMRITGGPGVQLSMATTNTDHIKIGDGTLATRNSRLNIAIEGLTFAPASGVAAFTSGACIRVQYGAFVSIEKCDFFGADGVGNKLWNGIELDRCEDSWITDCRGRRLRNGALFAYGASGIANRTVDVVIRRFRTSNNDGDHITFGPHSQGMFLIDWVGIGVAENRSGLYVNADPATEQGTNYFIVNPNIEAGNNPNSYGIYVNKGQGVDIQGGWAGGFDLPTQFGVWFGANSSSCMVNGMRLESIKIDGSACSVNGCELTGSLGVTPTGIVIGSGAQGFSIVGGRIRQMSTSGIAISGTPADGVISGLTFANIGSDNYISGAAYAGGPIVSSIRGQATRNITAASTTTVRYGVPLYQITGATAIGGFTPLAPGTELNVQAGAGGITINNSGNVILKAGTSLSLAAFTLRKFVCDGTNWFEV